MLKAYPTDSIFFHVGADFYWTNAQSDLNNVDAVINHFNDNPSMGIKAKYSTPTDYFTAL